MLSTKSRGAKNKLRAGIKNSSHIQVVGLRGRLWKHSASGYFLGLGLVAGSGAGRKQIFQSLHDIRLVRNTFPPGTAVCVYPFQFTETGEELLFGPSFPQYGSELHHSKGRGKTGFPPSEYRGDSMALINRQRLFF
jgi:hypothetical protein